MRNVEHKNEKNEANMKHKIKFVLKNLKIKSFHTEFFLAELM